VTVRLGTDLIYIDDRPFPARTEAKDNVGGDPASWYRRALLAFENRWQLSVLWSSASHATSIEVDSDRHAEDVEIAIDDPDGEPIGPHVVWGHILAPSLRSVMNEVQSWPTDLPRDEAYGRAHALLGDQEEG
jgi:hypothetical protein